MKKQQKPNLQNEHITKSLASVQEALQILIAKGLTVTQINIEGRNPLLSIQTSRHCAALPWAWTKTKVTPQGRITECVTTVNNCKVRWIAQTKH